LMIPIDHCLVSPQIRVTGMRTGRAIGSDHLPIIVDMMVPG
jgi:endonuclease/exonuclease/phosphatase (EEP) superfamily protein YafD